MASLPKPLIALLVATVAVGALWMAVLKKTVTGSGSSSGGAQSTPALQSAIAKAHQAVATSNAASVAHGGTVATTATPAQPATPAAKPATPAVKATTAVKPTTPGAPKANPATVHAVLKAIAEHKVVALLFFNPSATDDLEVKQELAGVPTQRGQVVKFAAPVNQLAQYSAVTSRVPVTQSPTLLVIDRQGETASLTGFVDQLAISQQIRDALSAK